MSADGMHKMATHRPKKIPLKQKICNNEMAAAVQKGLEGVWGNLSSKGSPKKRIPSPHSSFR